MMIDYSLVAAIFLLASLLITATFSAIQQLGKPKAESIILQEKQRFSPAKLFFVKERREFFSFAATVSQPFFLICYAVTGLIFLSSVFSLSSFPEGLWAVLIILFFALFIDFLVQCLARWQPVAVFKITSPFASVCLLALSFISYPLFKILKWLTPQKRHEIATSFRIKDKILEILQESEFAPYLDPNDQKLLLSVASFKERFVREIMVPRIDLFALPSDTSVQEAAKGFLTEKYSRIPVYKESVDNIIGVLYYKDVLNLFARSSSSASSLAELAMPIENLLKPVLYTPETKKISHLLQEFRSKQIHLAIVVDEYGGTEGIVTIEDILEELVGEIADEYDYDEKALFTQLPSGGWVVDAKMHILDIQEELGIKIPQGPEYETVGGYIFHKAGAIPSKGWRLHHDDFDLEVLSSDERSIDKIRITPHAGAA